MQHVFAVEVEEFKRTFIAEAFGDELEHLFADVAMFQVEAGGCGYCFKCAAEHKAPQVDILITGPSCKNCSKEFADRKNFANCPLGPTVLFFVENAVKACTHMYT